LVALQKAARLAPDHPAVHYSQAFYYNMIERDYRYAAYYFLKALEVYPDNNGIMSSLSKSYMNLGEWDKAKQYSLKAHDLWSDGFWPLLNLVEIYSYMHDWHKAEYYVDKLYNSHPESSFPYIWKARIVLMGYGDTEKTSKILKQAVQYSGQRGILKDRFLLDIWLRRYQDLLEAVESFPDFDDYFLYKGIAYWFMGQKDQAKTHLDSARIIHENLAQTTPRDINNYSLLGLAYAGLGMKDKAIQTAQKAVDLEPIGKNAYSGPYHHMWLAYIYSMVGENDRALDEIELLLSISFYFTTWDLKLNPFWDSMRDHPRFQELITKSSD
jgi:tetratricopeptide (TPR) repeat protein